MDLCAKDGAVTPELTTARLRLRPIGREIDIDAIAHWLSDRAVAQWLTMVPAPYRRSDAEWFVHEYLPGRPGPVFAIDAGAGLIGVISLDPTLGYWLARPFHGRGYMTEAVRAVLGWSFDRGARRVLSGHHDGNGASRAVLLKAGFQDSGAETVTLRADGSQRRVRKLALAREDWEAAVPPA